MLHVFLSDFLRSHKDHVVLGRTCENDHSSKADPNSSERDLICVLLNTLYNGAGGKGSVLDLACLNTCQLLIEAKVIKNASFIVLCKLQDNKSALKAFMKPQFNSHLYLLDLSPCWVHATWPPRHEAHCGTPRRGTRGEARGEMWVARFRNAVFGSGGCSVCGLKGL